MEVFKMLEFLWGFPKMLWSVLVLIGTLVTIFLDAGEVTSSSEVELVNEKCVVLEKALISGQGITTDGEYFYTSGSLTGISTPFIEMKLKFSHSHVISVSKFLKTTPSTFPQLKELIFGSLSNSFHILENG